MKSLIGCGLALALGLSCFAVPGTAAEKKPPARPAVTKTAATATGYTIAAAPAWVVPLAADPAIVNTMPTAPVQVLLRDHQTRVDPAAGSWRYQHAVRLIRDSAGLQSGSQIQFEFDPDYQRLVLHRLEIWREGRRIDKLADRSLVKILHREPNLERQMVDGRMTASIVLDDLRVGDRIEWAASLVGDNPVFQGRFVDQEWTSGSLGPIGLAHVRLLAPAARPIRHRENAKLGIEVEELPVKDGWRDLRFRRRAVPQFHYDPLLPPAEFLADQIEFSEFADWSDVARWADQLFAKAGGASGDAALAAEAAAISAKARAAGRDTPEERLRLALDFVQREIRYFGTEMGANSHQPATAEVVLKQRFGDCKDKAALLVNLLRRLDIEASPVLVSAFGREAVKTRLPSPLAFDHAIAAVKLPGQQDLTLWLDATRSQQTGTPASRQSYGLGRGLLARADATALSEMPPAREALRSETVATFRFPRLAEEGTFESVTTYRGDAAEWLRAARDSMPAEELQKALIGEISRAWPSFSQQGQALIEEVEGSNAVKVTLKFGTGASYWRFPDKRTLVGDFALLDLVVALRLPNQTPRSEAMQLGAGRYRSTLRYEFGEDAFPPPSAATASSRFDESNDWFALHMRYAATARTQQIDGELDLKADELAAGQWNAYRERLGKVFPRLGAALNVPALSPPQIAALRKSLDELADSVKSGRIKVTTPEQMAARTKLMIADRELAAGRLPPKLRAQVLQERGIQLDLLGLPEVGRNAFEDALQLDADNAELHGALATNALMRRQDAEAVQHAERALQLAPGDTGARYTRAWANYFDGKLPAARDELKDILQSSAGEVERGYGGIWLYLVSRRLGDDEGARAVPLPSDSQAPWPFAVLQLMQGRLDLDGALAMARADAKARAGRECELYFYAAQKALAEQDVAKARGLLRKSLDTGVVEFNEYSMAKRELDRIGAR